MRPAIVVSLPHLRLVDEGRATESLTEGLKAKKPWAERTLVEEQTPHVERLLTRILGRESELDDLVQEVFVRALGKVEELRDENVKSWLGAFAVNVAREAIRRRRRRSWLSFFAPEDMPDVTEESAAFELRDAVRALYRLLDSMNADDRVAFTLRVVEGMQLSEIATVCDVSLSTVKRRLQRAETWFVARAKRDPRLVDWVKS
jgi:RNA polymerase sigma-70 factor, ECF subfamily